MQDINHIIIIIGSIFGVLNFHKSIQLVIGLLFKAKKYPETSIKKRYGVVIPARNEEKVIGNLIESIYEQDYDQHLIDIFVVADNCSDNTAQIARDLGCIVYERFNDQKKRKGWAMEYLFENVQKDYGIESYDAYFIFDADNLLEPNFITEMNKAFVVNKNIVTSYRNTKNFETNWVSSAYGIHFYGRTATNHRPRNILGTGTHLSGTGFVISSHLIKDGWKYFTLTEDSELTMYMTANNIKIGYCEQAIHYDEQPTTFKVSFRQRVRWARGRLVVFFRTWHLLIKGIFKHKSFTNYDMLFYIMPYSLLTFILNIGYAIASLIVAIYISHSFSWSAIGIGLGLYWGSKYVSNLIKNALIVYRERKQIHCGFYRKLFYVVVSPWFQLISIFVMIFALFGDIQWIPVKHDDARKIGHINHIKSQLGMCRHEKLKGVRVLQFMGLGMIVLDALLYSAYRYLKDKYMQFDITFIYILGALAIIGLIVLLLSYLIQKSIMQKLLLEVQENVE
jgi:cellulose synthase/poly-beta-1,6-N-acetylglucosamine synthase-like glycosyltransferase